MPLNEPGVALEGSERTAIPGARDVGPVAPDERIELTIRIRPAKPGAVAAAAALVAVAQGIPGQLGYLSRRRLRAAGGADPAEVGQVLQFDKVLLYVAGEDVRVGTPAVKGVTVTAEVVAEVKGEKLVVFKRKRRKGMRNTKGHRQHYLEILIKEIKIG